MRFGLSVPNLGEYGDPRLLVDLARTAEEAGWDGFFLWDSLVADIANPTPVADPWGVLAAIATVTRRLRLGPLVTPLARRRPWVLARQTVTLDHLAGGRLILGVGLGDPATAEFAAFGEEPDARVRAAKLDEGLTILAGLWSGQPFQFTGTHYQVATVTFLPPPVQRPRIPVWVGGWWPHRRPLRRAARWDGAVPGKLIDGQPAALSPEEVREIAAYIGAHRSDPAPFDLVIPGTTPGGDRAAGAAHAADYAAAGATWWLEQVGPERGDLAANRQRIAQGPPR